MVIGETDVPEPGEAQFSDEFKAGVVDETLGGGHQARSGVGGDVPKAQGAPALAEPGISVSPVVAGEAAPANRIGDEASTGARGEAGASGADGKGVAVAHAAAGKTAHTQVRQAGGPGVEQGGRDAVGQTVGFSPVGPVDAGATGVSLTAAAAGRADVPGQLSPGIVAGQGTGDATSASQAVDAAVATAQPAAQQVGKALAALDVRPDGSSRLTITLHPAELGQVQVQILRAQDGQSSVSVAVERLDTLRTLQADLTHLHLALDRAGVSEQRSVTLALSPAPAAGEAPAQNQFSGGSPGSHRHAQDQQQSQQAQGSAAAVSRNQAEGFATTFHIGPALDRYLAGASGVNFTA